MDSADLHTFESAKNEIHELCEKESLYDIPILVLGNKNDLPESLSLEEVNTKLDISSILHHQVTCYSVSVKKANNLEPVLQWLLSKKPQHEQLRRQQQLLREQGQNHDDSDQQQSSNQNGQQDQQQQQQQQQHQTPKVNGGTKPHQD